MRKVRDIVRLAIGQGLSCRQVSASLGIPFTTVSDHLRRAKEANLGWPLPEGISDAELERRLFAKPPAPPAETRPVPEWNYVHRELRRPGVTLMLLWMEYKEAHPEQGYAYSQFCVHYRAWQRHLDLVMRQEHRAGEKLFVDFPGQRLPIYDRHSDAVAMQAELFVAVLGASNYLCAEAVASQDSASWIEAHVHAFEALQCLPKIVVPDNLASAVKKAQASDYAVYENAGLGVRIHRNTHPNDNGRVQNVPPPELGCWRQPCGRFACSWSGLVEEGPRGAGLTAVAPDRPSCSRVNGPEADDRGSTSHDQLTATRPGGR